MCPEILSGYPAVLLAGEETKTGSSEAGFEEKFVGEGKLRNHLKEKG